MQYGGTVSIRSYGLPGQLPPRYMPCHHASDSGGVFLPINCHPSPSRQDPYPGGRSDPSPRGCCSLLCNWPRGGCGVARRYSALTFRVREQSQPCPNHMARMGPSDETGDPTAGIGAALGMLPGYATPTPWRVDKAGLSTPLSHCVIQRSGQAAYRRGFS
jgi:hypothetical protein